jgi:predicted amidohydrolase
MITIAAIQMKPELMQSQSNLGSITRLTTEASENGAKMVVFPECCITGYGLTEAEAKGIAEPLPGPVSQRLTDMCDQLDVTVMVGTLESGPTGGLYNTAMLVDGSGVLGLYRKTHLPTLGVDRFVTPGEEIVAPVKTSCGLAGMQICYDLRFPEPARVLAVQGAQMILLSTAWPQAATLYPEFVVQARAAENHLYLIAANRIGEERGTTYLGRSIIADPDGQVLAEANQTDETILYAQIDPSRSDEKHRIFRAGEYELDLFKDRRPALYAKLTD